jgi:hypothetical protein
MVNYHFGWAVANKVSSLAYTVLQLQGNSWTTYSIALANAQNLYNVSAPSDIETWAVGDQSSSGVYSLLRWAGGSAGTWCRLTSSASACGKYLDASAFTYSGANNLLDIDTVDSNGDGQANFGFAVGGITSGSASNRVRILSYDGTKWSKSTISPSLNVQRLFGVKVTRFGSNAPIEAWAVGESTSSGVGVIIKWSGGIWSLNLTSPASLLAIDMLDINGDGLADVGLAVGTGGIAYLYQNGGWTGPYSLSSSNLNGVVILGASDMWIVGDLGVSLHYDGNSITSVTNGLTLNNLSVVKAVFPQTEPMSSWYELIN